MQTKAVLTGSSALLLLGLGAQLALAQAPTAPPTPQPTTAPGLPALTMRVPQTPPSVVAGIPVNYDEAKVGDVHAGRSADAERRQAGEEREDVVDEAAAGD